MSAISVAITFQNETDRQDSELPHIGMSLTSLHWSSFTHSVDASKKTWRAHHQFEFSSCSLWPIAVFQIVALLCDLHGCRGQSWHSRKQTSRLWVQVRGSWKCPKVALSSQEIHIKPLNHGIYLKNDFTFHRIPSCPFFSAICPFHGRQNISDQQRGAK